MGMKYNRFRHDNSECERVIYLVLVISHSYDDRVLRVLIHEDVVVEAMTCEQERGIVNRHSQFGIRILGPTRIVLYV
jgi:hypothetical protein